MNHWLTAPILIPLLGGILQALMAMPPPSRCAGLWHWQPPC